MNQQQALNTLRSIFSYTLWMQDDLALTEQVEELLNPLVTELMNDKDVRLGDAIDYAGKWRAIWRMLTDARQDETRRLLRDFENKLLVVPAWDPSKTISLPALNPTELCGMCGHTAEEHRDDTGYGPCHEGAGCGGKCPCGQYEPHEFAHQV